MHAERLSQHILHQTIRIWIHILLESNFNNRSSHVTMIFLSSCSLFLTETFNNFFSPLFTYAPSTFTQFFILFIICTILRSCPHVGSTRSTQKAIPDDDILKRQKELYMHFAAVECIVDAFRWFHWFNYLHM